MADYHTSIEVPDKVKKGSIEINPFNCFVNVPHQNLPVTPLNSPSRLVDGRDNLPPADFQIPCKYNNYISDCQFFENLNIINNRPL